MANYSTESLKAGIESCKKNITVFEEAITKERATITEYYEMISVIERKERESKTIELKAEQENQ